VALVGSTRFKQMFEEVNRVFTLDGLIVLGPGVFPHSGDDISTAQKAALDELHLHKISLADWVFVVDPGGYIGKSTRLEIVFAESLYKPVRYLEPVAQPRSFLSIAGLGSATKSPARLRSLVSRLRKGGRGRK
jgi:hypothetical protein